MKSWRPIENNGNGGTIKRFATLHAMVWMFLLKSAKALVGSLKFMSFHFGFLVTRLESITFFYLSIIYNFVFLFLFFSSLDDAFEQRNFFIIKYSWKSSKNYKEAIQQQRGLGECKQNLEDKSSKTNDLGTCLNYDNVTEKCYSSTMTIIN